MYLYNTRNKNKLRNQFGITENNLSKIFISWYQTIEYNYASQIVNQNKKSLFLCLRLRTLSLSLENPSISDTDLIIDRLIFINNLFATSVRDHFLCSFQICIYK